MNSISVHRLQDEKAHLDDIVAILTNNDQTVRIYSLPTGQETRVKDLPFAINHATLSPDGKMLVAVGDLNQAYFFTREILDKAPQIPKPHNRLGAKDCDWRLTNVVSLHTSESTVGYFTTAWSPSGALVALGSEGGYITVLDRELLESRDVEDDDAIVAVVAGSRADVPSPYPGAIRSMVFSPEPWDLLCWAEDQGRVCIGDLRTGLKSRQVIHLEPESSELERLVVEDIGGVRAENGPVLQRLDDLEEDILRRYGGSGEQWSERQSAEPSISSVNFATEYIETRRRQRAARQELALREEQRDALRGMLDGDPQGLTEREQQILETLRTSRQREEARASGGPAANVTYTTPDLFGSAPRSTTRSTSGTTASTRPVNEFLNTVQESLPALERSHSTASPRAPSAPDASLAPMFSVDRVISSLRQTPTQGSFSSPSRLPRIRQSVLARDPEEHQPSTTTAEAENEDEDEEGSLWRSIEEHLLDASLPTARGPLFEGAGRAAPITTTTEDGESSRALRLREHIRLREQVRLRERWRPSENATQSDRLISRQETTTEEQTIRERYEALMRAGGLRMGLRMGFAAGEGEAGVRTAGLAISEDGGRLWIACESGIFEVRVGLRGRLSWGALEMR